MFKTYRQKGCHFECRLRYAARLANCIPWDYPIPKGFEGIAICLAVLNGNGTNSLKIFHDKMDDPNSLKNCSYDCLPDCEEVKFNIQARTSKIVYYVVIYLLVMNIFRLIDRI